MRGLYIIYSPRRSIYSPRRAYSPGHIYAHLSGHIFAPHKNNNFDYNIKLMGKEIN